MRYNSRVLKTYCYRIYPTSRQQVVLETQLALCAELYNAALQERRDAWRFQRKRITYFDQTRQLTQIKDDRNDIASINANVLENVLKRVQRAFDGFFQRAKNRRKAGYPRFRSARRYDSLTFRQSGARHPINSRIQVSKVGRIRARIHRPVEGAVKTLTVKRRAGRWFALYICDVDPKPLPFSPQAVGVDVGLSAFATLSDGTVIENPRYYAKAEARLRIAQRRVSRRKKGSRRRRKAVQLLQSVYARMNNQRADFHHNLSASLVRNNGLIAVEDLSLSGLRRGNAGKAISDAGWATFINMLAYKAESAGRVLVKVDPRKTSQICTCGAEARKTLRQRWHLCLNCGLSANRDHVAAQVILSRAGVQPSGVNVGEVVPCVV